MSNIRRIEVKWHKEKQRESNSKGDYVAWGWVTERERKKDRKRKNKT